MKDISERKDIETLVDEFYKKVIPDPEIGYIFTEVEPLDWEKHIPIMYNFWESILLGNPVYKGNPMTKHIQLNKKEPLTAEHFQRWLYLWEETIHANFEGPKADEAVARAKHIAALMRHKISEPPMNIV
ncbi:group III truncated hemoglobin [bacterium]|nr:group III truncated hemoglobin [bacterium]